MLRLIALAPLAACGFSANTGSSIDGGVDGPGNFDDAAPDAPDAPDGAIDAAVDAMPDMMVPSSWTAPQQLGIVGSDPTLTANLLDIWFVFAGDIYHASRPSVFVAFGTPSRVNELSTLNIEASPEVSPDGNTIYFTRLTGNNDLYVSTRASNSDAWSTPQSILELNTSDHEQGPSMSADGQMLAMSKNPLIGSPDIYISTRNSPSSPWSSPVAVTEVNSAQSDTNVFLSPDKLTLCFDSTRATVARDIYCAKRSSPTEPFGTPVVLPGINSALNDGEPWLSASGTLLVFSSDRDGVGRLYFSFYQ